MNLKSKEKETWKTKKSNRFYVTVRSVAYERVNFWAEASPPRIYQEWLESDPRRREGSSLPYHQSEAYN